MKSVQEGVSLVDVVIMEKKIGLYHVEEDVDAWCVHDEGNERSCDSN